MRGVMSVMCGSCLGDALLMSRGCRGDVLVMLLVMYWWCVGLVSVVSICLRVRVVEMNEWNALAFTYRNFLFVYPFLVWFGDLLSCT